MSDAKRIRLVLVPLPHAELVAAQSVEEVGSWLGFSRDTLDEVKLAVVEACLNALEYGGGEVEVELVAHANGDPTIEVSIVDGGPGFDPTGVEAPHLEEKLRTPRKRGWGLELMRRLMDRVEIHSEPGRTRVHMVRSRGGV